MALGSGMSLLFGGYVVMMAASIGHHVYSNFLAPQCPATGVGVGGRPCVQSLFAQDEQVRTLAFATSKSNVAWWTLAGLAEMVPLTANGTEMLGAFSMAREAVFPLNGSVIAQLTNYTDVGNRTKRWWLHCFVVRDGVELEDAIRAAEEQLGPSSSSSSSSSSKVQLPRYPGGSHLVTPDVLHVQTHLTESRQPRRERKQLATKEAAANEDWRPWVATGFISTAFASPNIGLATFRHMLLAGGVSMFVQQAQKNAANASVTSIDEVVVEPEPEEGPIPHIRAHVELVFADDYWSYSYGPRQRPPQLFSKIEMDKNGGMRQTPVHYFIAKQNRTEKFVPPMSIPDAESNVWAPIRQEHIDNTSNSTVRFILEMKPTHVLKYCMLETMKQYLKLYEQMGIPMGEVVPLLMARPLHMIVFEQVVGLVKVWLTGLAFKNDISFFRGRENYRGLSSRSLLTETLQDILLFLYFCDLDETSNIYLFQFGISVMVSAYKYVKVSQLAVYFAYMLPWVLSRRATDADEEERQTEEFDAEGMRYASYVLHPTAACFGIYCLYYYTYKSWWSWLLSSLMNMSYSLHFLNMLPQVFINYKLQSVAHMPWRVLTLKFFNTFIDDVYAWIVARQYFSFKYRIMTLQDDVIFFILMWQRYKYKVDYNRPDEFGYTYTEEGENKVPPVKDDAATTAVEADAAKAKDADDKAGSKAKSPRQEEEEKENDPKGAAD